LYSIYYSTIILFYFVTYMIYIHYTYRYICSRLYVYFTKVILIYIYTRDKKHPRHHQKKPPPSSCRHHSVEKCERVPIQKFCCRYFPFSICNIFSIFLSLNVVMYNDTNNYNKRFDLYLFPIFFTYYLYLRF